MDIELRDASVTWPEVDMEVRAEGDGLSFRGYAAVFDTWSQDLGGYRERIAPGAFTRSVNAAMNGGRDIKMFLNHNWDVVLASTRKGSDGRTMTLTQDERGLLVEARLPDSEWGRPVAEAVRRGDISTMSFGFNVAKGGDSWSDDHAERTLSEVKLWEVSPVTAWPAYTATSASVRNLVDIIDWSDDDSPRAVLDGLTDEQRTILHRLLNREQPEPFISPAIVTLRERFAARRADAARRGINLPDPEPGPGALDATTPRPPLGDLTASEGSPTP